MSIELLENAAGALEGLVEEVAFLGGAAFVLWISDPAAAPFRPTKDVDVIVEVGSRVEYYSFGERLRERGFEEDSDRALMCAWRHRPSGLLLDVMPTDEAILGFSNDWYASALAEAARRTLPSGAEIRAVTPPFLLATKIAAFRGRGKGDYLASVDFGDLIALIDGRPELTDEVRAASEKIRAHLSGSFRAMREEVMFDSGVRGALPFLSQGRAPIVLARVEEIVAAATSSRALRRGGSRTRRT